LTDYKGLSTEYKGLSTEYRALLTDYQGLLVELTCQDTFPNHFPVVCLHLFL